MVPNVSKSGHSFKGAYAYFLHDKGQDEQGRRLETSERVAWTETVNLATENPHVAWRIMVATADRADELKAAAGIKTTGRKATGGSVYSYSLSWRGDEAEGLTREDMAAAAHDTLKVLGADHLQAVIVAHRDTDNPHVHVIVNRIDPATGKTHSVGQDWTKLDRWAARYEKERGQIVTPRRQEKEQAREANPDPAKRREYVEARRKAQAERTPTPAQALKQRGDQQKADHKQQWAQLGADQKAARSAIYEAAGGKIKQRLAIAREEYRPLWRELHGRQKAERQAYELRERHLSGKVKNAIDAVTQRQIRGDGSDAGFLTMAWGYLRSRDDRRFEFDNRQSGERDRLAAATKQLNVKAIDAIKADREKQLEHAREQTNKRAGDLKAQQAKERGEIREAWKAHYLAKEQARGSGEGEARQPREYRPRIRQQEAKDARRESRAAWHQETARRTANAERAEVVRERRAAQQEPQAVKNDHDRARDPKPIPPPVPNRTVSLSRPTPAPSPAGDVPPATRKPAAVPIIDRDAAFKQAALAKPPPSPRFDWAKVQPKPVQATTPAPAPRAAFEKAAARSPQPATAPLPPPACARIAPEPLRASARPLAPERPQTASTTPPRPEQQPRRFDWSKVAPKPTQQAPTRPPEQRRSEQAPQRPQEAAQRQERKPEPIARPIPVTPSQAPQRAQERPQAPTPAPARPPQYTQEQSRQQEPQQSRRFDWGKAAEGAPERPREQPRTPDLKRDYDRER